MAKRKNYKTILVIALVSFFGAIGIANGQEAAAQPAATQPAAKEPAPKKEKTCSCKKESDISNAFSNYSAIFIGRADEQNSSALKPGMAGYKFRLTKNYKGLEDFPIKFVTVYSPKEEKDCGFKFARGSDYIIFVTGNPASYKTDACTPTEHLDAATLTVERLNRIVNKGKPKKKKKNVKLDPEPRLDPLKKFGQL